MLDEHKGYQIKWKGEKDDDEGNIGKEVDNICPRKHIFHHPRHQQANTRQIGIILL